MHLMTNCPKIRSVTPLPNAKLQVEFVTGEIKIYDCQPLLTEAAFQSLRDEAFFRSVQVDTSGYGVVWDDNTDLSEAELWLNGETEKTEFQ
jgi:hypothetical protein